MARSIVSRRIMPHMAMKKNAKLLKAPFGIVGSEYAFQLLYTHFVKTGRFTLQQLVDWMTVKPASLFGLSAGTMMVGDKADLAIFDLESAYNVDPKQFLSKESIRLSVDGRYMGIRVIHL